MEDRRLEERKKAFLDPAPVSIASECEDFARRLRKEKRDLVVSAKRGNTLPATASTLQLESASQTIELLRSGGLSADSRLSLLRTIRSSMGDHVLGELIPTLISAMAQSDSASIGEIVWTLANASGGDDPDVCGLIVKHGGHTMLLKLLEGAVDDPAEESCIWTLGNIAAETAELRDELVRAGTAERLARVLSGRRTAKLSLLRTACWAFANLCGGTRPPLALALGCVERLRSFLPMAYSLLEVQDREVAESLLQAFLYLTKTGSRSFRHGLVQSLSLVYPWLRPTVPIEIRELAARLLNCLSAGPESDVAGIVASGGIKAAAEMLASTLTGDLKPQETILTETCATLQNIARMGAAEHLGEILSSGAVRALCRVVASADLSFHVRCPTTCG